MLSTGTGLTAFGSTYGMIALVTTSVKANTLIFGGSSICLSIGPVGWAILGASILIGLIGCFVHYVRNRNSTKTFNNKNSLYRSHSNERNGNITSTKISESPVNLIEEEDNNKIVRIEHNMK